MLGTWPLHDLPHLTRTNCATTSPTTNAYNCIAWAAGENHRWWWPDAMSMAYWPQSVPRTESLASFEAAYATLGYQRCSDGSLQPQIEKIAIFATQNGPQTIPTHAARQLKSGKWTSKLGGFEDIEHTAPGDVSGPVYGSVILFMARPVS